MTIWRQDFSECIRPSATATESKSSQTTIKIRSKNSGKLVDKVKALVLPNFEVFQYMQEILLFEGFIGENFTIQ